ncbi:hypothetical protein [Solimonas terrae]|uniref:DUF2946 domain-containing protein n=1 Tax=Solimonas terrae TaxID=1396819 RepID=A0A6M2BV93_9GAMM|nr:hypothetical protein [Solimonas terrae]NGY05867.1 hypothetical protein [Solimonas terrae]
MRRHFKLRLLLLAAALALGQWLWLAHGFEHPALQTDAACQICAHGQGLDGSALAPSLQLPSQFAISEAPAPAIAVVAALAPRTRQRIRGPPLHLA